MKIIEIEKGIPVPSKYHEKAPKYPLDKMDVGDSFFLEIVNGKKHSSLVQTITRYKKDHPGVDFTTRKITKPLGIRVWRTK